MPRLSLATRSSLVALTLAVLLGISEFVIARQSAPPAQSKPDDKPASQAEGGQDSTKTKAKTKGKASRASKARARRDPPGFYMGRRIADVMTWDAADWLFRETRIDEEQPEAMLDALKIPRGATVADVGAGAGYHSIRLARRVGPQGVVLASDVQPEMLRMLPRQRPDGPRDQHQAGPLTQADPKLPEAKVDLILMVDVYHECSDPEATLQGLFKALKPSGRLVLVEFRGEDPDVPIKPEHKMTLQQVRREIEPRGFVFKESLEFLPWQHVIIFAKPDATDPKPDAGPKATPAPGKSRPAPANGERP